MTMRFGAAALFMGLMLASQPALAWGPRGHAVVADIAQADLNRTARIQVAQLLAQEKVKDLSQIASWADEERNKGVLGTPSHSIRFPAKGPLRMDACPNHFCALTAVDRYSALLANRRASPAARLVALKYVVHLVGDIHTPLHAFVSTGDKVAVRYRGQVTTLHKLWDYGLMGEQGGNRTKIEQKLASRRGDPLGGRPIDWALESRNIARDDIFRTLPLRSKTVIDLPDDYGAENWPIIAERLNQAGHRLGALLNRLLS
jgi:hypothetical protein